MFDWLFGNNSNNDEPQDDTPQETPVYTNGDDLVDANGDVQHVLTSEVLTANDDVQVQWNADVPYQDNDAFGAYLAAWHAEHNPGG